MRIELEEARAEILRGRAREKQGRRTDLFPNSGKSDDAPVHVDKQIATASGVGHDTVHKARVFVMPDFPVSRESLTNSAPRARVGEPHVRAAMARTLDSFGFGAPSQNFRALRFGKVRAAAMTATPARASHGGAREGAGRKRIDEEGAPKGGEQPVETAKKESSLPGKLDCKGGNRAEYLAGRIKAAAKADPSSGATVSMIGTDAGLRHRTANLPDRTRDTATRVGPCTLQAKRFRLTSVTYRGLDARHSARVKKSDGQAAKWTSSISSQGRRA